MASEPVLWPPPPPVVAGKSVQQTLIEIRAILELQLLKHESTVNEYAKQFEAILPYAPISNASAINIFILGLRSEIRNAVLDLKPSNLDSAIYFAYLQEKYGKKVNQEAKNAKIDVVKGDEVASCPNDHSQIDNIAVENHAQNNELVAEARGTMKDDDKGAHESMTDLEAHEVASQENDIQKEEYGRLEQPESKIMKHANPKRTEGEADAVLNLTADVAKETYEIPALKVNEAANVAATVNLIDDVIVEEDKCVRIKHWSKTQAMQDSMPAQYTFLSFPHRRFFFANRLLHFQPIQGLHKKVYVRVPERISPSAVLRPDELYSVGQPPPLAVLSLKSWPAAVHTVVPEAVKSPLSSLFETGRVIMKNGDIPEDANEHCTSPQSVSAGKFDACEGCPYQQMCATAPKGPDPNLVSIAEIMANGKDKILVLSGKGEVGKSTFSAQLTFALVAMDFQISLPHSVGKSHTETKNISHLSRLFSGRICRKFCNELAAVWSSRSLPTLLTLFLPLSVVALLSAQGYTRNTWKTLNGNAPLVIAFGEFSGVYPDASLAAYNLALIASLPNVVSWCDVLSDFPITPSEPVGCFARLSAIVF